MAKFFGKKDKKKNEPETKQAFRTLSEEEAKIVDRKEVPRDEMIAALRAMGKTDKEIKEIFPDPLSRQEQEKLLNEVRRLFSAQKYKEVIDTYLGAINNNILTGDVMKEVCFAIGFSAIMTEDRQNIQRFADWAALYLMTVSTQVNSQTMGTVLEIMRRADACVPGSIKKAANSIYALLRDACGEDHEWTKRVEEFI